MLGEVAWEQMLNDNKSELPNTKFMGGLKTCEQFQQLNDDILRGMNISRKEFCNTDHHTLQEAKDQLHALLTDIMMDDA